MNQEEINKQAALSLINRAMEVTKQGCAHMLIDTAATLDESINRELLKATWLEHWLMKMQNRTTDVNFTL